MPRTFALSIAIVVATAVLTAEPRLRPAAAGLTDEQRALTATYSRAFGTGADFRTLLIHPELVKGVLPFANYILAESTLTARHRDLLILRTAWLTRSGYLWAKHQGRALAAPANDFERTLQRTADELHHYSFITNETWGALSQRYNVHELMDAVFTVAEMTMIAAIVNSVQTYWQRTFRGYEPARTRFFDGVIQTGCGQASPAVGPFYCPQDEKIYLDLDFFRELRNRFGAPGDFAQAYVLAHEIGHHVDRFRDANYKTREGFANFFPFGHDKIPAAELILMSPEAAQQPFSPKR